MHGNKNDFRQALIIAPLSARGTSWVRRFGEHSTGYASGWMRIRGTRRRQAIDRGFVLSDHADWDGLISTIKATGAERIGVTHGYVPEYTRWLREQGLDAYELKTLYGEEENDDTGEVVEEA
jgi:putative mRNA 3-end processing factor